MVTALSPHYLNWLFGDELRSLIRYGIVHEDTADRSAFIPTFCCHYSLRKKIARMYRHKVLPFV
jgi:hypothetical protein